MANVPVTEPTELRAGDTWRWRREDLADYPAGAGWSLNYHFRNATHKFDVAAAADGNVFAVTVAKATTAARVAGAYDWIAVASNATERFEVARGRVQLLPDLAADVLIDTRSTARKALDKIDAWLGGDRSPEVAEYTIGDRAMKYHDPEKLLAMRSKLKAEVVREENTARIAQGLAPRNKILARFG